MNPEKPLGIKAYGSIPHLPGSRLGPGDHSVNAGQEKICTQKARDRHDQIFVQEKLDGSCVAVAKITGNIVPLTRAGYLANTTPYLQHQLFYDWVFYSYQRFDQLLNEGERVCGEWLALAHGTRYNLPHEPLVVFDIFRNNKRLTVEEFTQRVQRVDLIPPRLIHHGEPISIESIYHLLEPSGHGAIDPVEGAVWRVERQGKVDFLAKWVRKDKVDGAYFSELTGQPDIWNWQPKTA